MKELVDISDNWTAVKFSTGSNYQTSSWHVIPPQGRDSMCGKADVEGAKRNKKESKLSRSFERKNRSELRQELGQKLGSICQKCGDRL